MAKIIINGEQEIKGKFSLSNVCDLSKKPPEVITEGRLITHRYFDDIQSIQSDRYLLEGVQVLKESFGSDDETIIYDFIAKDFRMKKQPYDEAKTKEIEDKLFGED